MERVYVQASCESKGWSRKKQKRKRMQIEYYKLLLHGKLTKEEKKGSLYERSARVINTRLQKSAVTLRLKQLDGLDVEVRPA